MVDSGATCSGEDGTCPRPAKKRGLCWAHLERLKGGKKPLAAPVKDYARRPMEGLYRAALAYKDELDTATDEEFKRSQERFRFALRQYLWVYVPDLLRKQPFTSIARSEIDQFLKNYGDKSKHAPPRRQPTQHNPRSNSK